MVKMNKYTGPRTEQVVQISDEEVVISTNSTSIHCGGREFQIITTAPL